MPLTFARAYFGRTVGELFFGLCKTYYTHSSHSYYNWTYGACQRICCKITKKRVWNYFSVFPVILLSNASLTLTIEHLNQNTDNIWNYFFNIYRKTDHTYTDTWIEIRERDYSCQSVHLLSSKCSSSSAQAFSISSQLSSDKSRVWNQDGKYISF